MSADDKMLGMVKAFLALSQQIEEAKQLYDLRDELILQMKSCGFSEATHDGQKLVLKDNFAQKNVAWRMAAVNRYEIKITKE